MCGERVPVFARDCQFDIFFLAGKKTTSSVSLFQIIEVTSRTIYESKNVFLVNGKTLFFVCFLIQYSVRRRKLLMDSQD